MQILNPIPTFNSLLPSIYHSHSNGQYGQRKHNIVEDTVPLIPPLRLEMYILL